MLIKLYNYFLSIFRAKKPFKKIPKIVSTNNSHSYPFLREFEGKTVLITGAGKGLGAKIALAFGKAGANVVVNYLKSGNEAKKLVEDLKQSGSDSIALKADVSKRFQIETMISKVINKYGNIDILINNAAVLLKPSDWKTMSSEGWQETLNVNIFGVAECIRATAKHMSPKNKCKIVNMSTFGGGAYIAAYLASKAAVNELTKIFAQELSPRINVNAVALSEIKMSTDTYYNKYASNKYILETPLKRFGNINDVINAVLFLSSSRADFITGHVLVVDGGRRVRIL
ncbi:MAG: SDR family oxidoreductase [Patescibacteria group bacterium]